MGLKSFFRRFKSCCQGNSDNYFTESSYKDEKRISTEDFLKKPVEEIEVEENEKSHESIFNESKISEVKHIEIDESSILSDKNIDQLRLRNPRLNRFDNDVIRLSLRKSLYANNLEQDLEYFLKDQQRENNRYDNKDNPYSISDLRELYDLINTISVKDEEKSNSEKSYLFDENQNLEVQEEKVKTTFKCEDQLNKEKPNSSNEKPKNEIENNQNLEIQDNLNKESISTSTDGHVNNSLTINTKIINNIPINDNKNSETTNELLEKVDSNHINNSPDTKLENSIINEHINQSPNQNQIINTTILSFSKNNDIQNKKSSNTNNLEMVFQAPNNVITEPSQTQELCTSPQQTYSDTICQSPNDDTEFSHNILCNSPQQNDYEIDNLTSDDVANQQNLIYYSSHVECQSPEEEEIEEEELNTIPTHKQCESPQQSFSNVICHSPEEEKFFNNTQTHHVQCESPEQSFSNVICHSPEEEEFNNNQTYHVQCESPQQSFSNMICHSPEEINFNNIQTQNVQCNSPKQSFTNMICQSPEEENITENQSNTLEEEDEEGNNSQINNSLFTSPHQKLSEPIHSSPYKKDRKQIRRSTGGAFLFDPLSSFGSLANSSINSNKNHSPISSHEKDLLFSQLKMTELSKKDESPIPVQYHNILRSFKSLPRNYNSNSRNSSINNDDRSIFSYDSIENRSTRKITRRGLKVLKSRDTFERLKPVNLKKRNRKALLIGINYINKPYELKGCINDANYLMRFLKENYDFKPENCKVMTDDSEDETLIPTKENIINAMEWLIKDAKAGDSLFFHYSGHGLSIVDEDGDEIDGMDESILPVDYEENGVILDDEINELIVKPLPKGCLLTALADCCHSGTVFDLPYLYSTNGKIESVEEIDEDYKEISKEYLTNDIYKKNKMVQNLVKRNTTLPPVKLTLEERMNIFEYAKTVKRSEADVIQYSSCRDNEISADERANGNTYGALCNAFISTLTSLILEEKSISYIDLLIEIRKIIQKRYGQTPQLSTGRPMDVSKPFEL